jgi:DNA invertase Pin-like site-specific DNA recombinase
MTTGELAVKFFRVSSDTQDEKNQVAAVDKHFEACGYVEAREPFKLHDVSASKGEHEAELAEILSDIRAGRYTVVVIANSARIDRRDPDLQEFWALSVRIAGGRIESASEPEFGKSTLSGKVVTLLAQQANYDYTKTLSTNVLNSFERIDANGAIRNKAGYGHRITGDEYHKRFVLDEAEAEIIRECVRRYLAGQSLAHICRWLTANGHRGRKGAAFTPKTLGSILRSETLIGRFHQGDVVARVPRIISIKDHKAVLAKLDAKAYRKGTRSRADTALLTSILHCGACGAPMYAVKSDGTSRRLVWNADRTAKILRKYPTKVVHSYYCRSRKGCKMLLPMEATDAAIGERLLASGITATQEVTIKGHNFDDDIDQIALDIQRLDPLAPGYRAALDEKLAEIDRLRLLPAVPDRTETRVLDTSELAQAWEGWTKAQRRTALLETGLRLYAVKDAEGNVTLTNRMPAMGLKA